MSLDEDSAASELPTPCLLFANPYVPYVERVTHQRELEELLARAFDGQPVLAIHVGREAISVTDPASNAFIASAWLSEVAARPETYSPTYEAGEGVSTLYTQPQLHLEMPGKRNLRIAILPMRYETWSGHQFRYAWRSKARARNSSAHALSPTHVVSETEWFSLLEKFGLAALVIDEYESGKLDRRERFEKVIGIAGWTAVVGAIAAIALLLVWEVATGHH